MMNVAELSGSLVRVALNRMGSMTFYLRHITVSCHIHLFYTDLVRPMQVANTAIRCYTIELLDIRSIILFHIPLLFFRP